MLESVCKKPYPAKSPINKQERKQAAELYCSTYKNKDQTLRLDPEDHPSWTGSAIPMERDSYGDPHFGTVS